MNSIDILNLLVIEIIVDHSGILNELLHLREWNLYRVFLTALTV